MHRLRILAAAVLAAVAAVTLATAVSGQEDRRKAKSAVAKLSTPEGKRAGTVIMTQRGRRLDVTVRARRLTEGFHGFHMHETGECRAPSSDGEESGPFLSAGGHYARGDQDHGEHAGDMPSLLVRANGRASASFIMPGRLAPLTRGDGTAVMIHTDRDNFANIPGRYDPEPDAETLSTGDAGDRAACGVVTRG